MKKQVVIIGGGNTFDSYKQYISFLKKRKIDFDRIKSKKWKDNLEKDLGMGFDVIMSKMPNPSSAKYLE